ncbi:MAG: hypothetical protein [Caudoviricetes sp.]|nr:MAG: hypothetical protein [Caudoviricetes sp.]
MAKYRVDWVPGRLILNYQPQIKFKWLPMWLDLGDGHITKTDAYRYIESYKERSKLKNKIIED